TFLVWWRDCSNLARAIIKASFTTNKTSPNIGDPAPPCDPSKARWYESYVVYCTMHGVQPCSLEHWDALRDLPITTTTVDPLLYTRELVDFSLDALLVKGNLVGKYIESLIKGAKPRHKVTQFFRVLVQEFVGVRDASSCDQKD